MEATAEQITALTEVNKQLTAAITQLTAALTGGAAPKPTTTISLALPEDEKIIARLFGKRGKKEGTK